MTEVDLRFEWFECPGEALCARSDCRAGGCIIKRQDEQMAPSDLGWHYRYEVAFHKMEDLLTELQNDPAFKDAEDLGDYVDTVQTLLSFRPRTRDDIVQKAIQDCYPELKEVPAE